MFAPVKTASKKLPGLTAAVSAALALSAAERAPLKVGDAAPSIEGKDQAGKTWTLKEALRTRAVLLYFYPKDDTPGCTRQACGLRDRLEDFQKATVQVVGVSFDTAESHQQFVAKHRLNFPLLADTEGRIADAFGVRIAGKNMARRVSFLIGRDGKILHITDSPDAEVHLREMQEAIGKLPSS